MIARSGSRLLARLRRSQIARRLDAVRRAAERRGEALYLVGGCVRDLLLRRPLNDLDLVVEGDPAGLAREAARALAGECHGPTAFGTCRIESAGGIRIDVAMARREIYRSPAALPEVTPAPVEEDLLRRDFTINALAVGLTGPARSVLLDPAGGLRDLEAGRLRILHAASLVDDPTRAFRAARYAARYGFAMAAGWLGAIGRAGRRGAFRRLSPARLRRELELIWSDTAPEAALSRAARWGLLRTIHARLAWAPGLREAVGRAAASRAGADPALLLFALFAASIPPASREALCSRLGLEGEARALLLRAARAPREAERLLRASRRPASLDRCIDAVSRWDPLEVRAASSMGTLRQRRLVEDLRSRWDRAATSLRGSDLIALGVPRGPLVGAISRALRLARAAGRVRTRRQEKALAGALLAGSRP